MAKKRAQKPLKVRESVARYILRGRPCAALADIERAQRAGGGVSSLERAPVRPYAAPA